MIDSLKKELAELCHDVGRKIPVWTQGAGGNISIKDGGSLWIKATGYRLDKVDTNQGIAHVDSFKMAQILEKSSWETNEAEQKYADLIRDTTLPGLGLGRPSMETGFHARLSQKYILHFHSLAALLICHEYRRNQNKMMGWLKEKSLLTFEFVEPCRPGWILSKRVGGDRSIYFLESHGIILQAQNREVLEQWEQLEKDFCKEFDYLELLDLLNSNLSFEKLFEKYGTRAIPFKCYFPDVAVFIERLNKVLELSPQGLCVFRSEAVHQDRDMAELWLATQLLYHFCPEFEEVPEDIAREIKDLPTEKIRQQRDAKHGK